MKLLNPFDLHDSPAGPGLVALNKPAKRGEVVVCGNYRYVNLVPITREEFCREKDLLLSRYVDGVSGSSFIGPGGVSQKSFENTTEIHPDCQYFYRCKVEYARGDR